MQISMTKCNGGVTELGQTMSFVCKNVQRFAIQAQI